MLRPYITVPVPGSDLRSVWVGAQHAAVRLLMLRPYITVPVPGSDLRSVWVGAQHAAPLRHSGHHSARKWLPMHVHPTASCAHEWAMASARQHAPPVDQTAWTRLFSSRNLCRDD